MTVVPLRPPRPKVSTSATPVARRRWLLRPGWPLTWMLVGFPLWWVLGISSFIGHIAAVLMVLELARLRRIRVPRSFGVWLLFLAWVVAGVLVLQVAAPYASPGVSSGRYISFAYRLGWYLSATVVLVYVGNMRDVLSTTRIVRAGAAMFLTIVAGGWLGVLLPHLVFPSLLEALLPGAALRVEFVQFLVHPQIVQDYARAVAEFPRPSAPFAYANIWGLNFACFLPFFLVGWLGKDAGWRRTAGIPVLLLALVPGVLSLNRGMWLAVGCMVAVVAVRSALRGSLRSLVAVGAGVVVVLALVALTPLGAQVQDRFENPKSTETRSNVAATTVASVMEGSPVLGFGSTRDPATAFYSVAGGDSPSCPECAPPALGTQGHFWLVLYSQGLLGLLLFIYFHGVWLVRGLTVPSPVATAATCLLVGQAATLLIYDSLGIGTVAALLAVGLIWRERDRLGLDVRPDAEAEYTLNGYIRLVRSSAVLLGVCALVGGAAGLGVGALRESPVTATVSLHVPEEYESSSRPTSATLDTLSYLADGQQVMATVRRAAGPEIGPDDVVVTADTNTRILNVTVTGPDADTALAAADAAGRALLLLRYQLMEQRYQDEIAQSDAAFIALASAIGTVDDALAGLGEAPDATTSRFQVLEAQRQQLLHRAGVAAGVSGRPEVLVDDAGQVVRSPTVRHAHDSLLVHGSTGLVLGLLVGLLIGRLRGLAGPPLSKVRDLPSETGITALGRVSREALSERGSVRIEHRQSWQTTVDAARLHAPVTVVAVGDDPTSARLAGALDVEVREEALSALPVRRLDPRNRLLLVASHETRLGTLRSRAEQARHAGLDVVGLVLIKDEGVGRPHPPRFLNAQRSKGI